VDKSEVVVGVRLRKRHGTDSGTRDIEVIALSSKVGVDKVHLRWRNIGGGNGRENVWDLSSVLIEMEVDTGYNSTIDTLLGNQQGVNMKVFKFYVIAKDDKGLVASVVAEGTVIAVDVDSAKATVVLQNADKITTVGVGNIQIVTQVIL
jgi:hypothetical protein